MKQQNIEVVEEPKYDLTLTNTALYPEEKTEVVFNIISINKALIDYDYLEIEKKLNEIAAKVKTAKPIEKEEDAKDAKDTIKGLVHLKKALNTKKSEGIDLVEKPFKKYKDDTNAVMGKASKIIAKIDEHLDVYKAKELEIRKKGVIALWQEIVVKYDYVNENEYDEIERANWYNKTMTANAITTEMRQICSDVTAERLKNIQVLKSINSPHEKIIITEYKKKYELETALALNMEMMNKAKKTALENSAQNQTSNEDNEETKSEYIGSINFDNRPTLKITIYPKNEEVDKITDFLDEANIMYFLDEEANENGTK